MSRTKKILFRSFIAIIGFPILAIGIVLIPLPGPGLLLCFLGLFILSLAFDSAKTQLETYKSKIKEIINKTKEKQERINRKIDRK